MSNQIMSLYANLINLYVKLADASRAGNWEVVDDLERQVREATVQYDTACTMELDSASLESSPAAW